VDDDDESVSPHHHWVSVRISKHTMFLIVCLLFIATRFQTAASSSMVICDYDKIVHRWLAFETNASFLDHDEDVISAHCSRLRDLFQDEGEGHDEAFEGEAGHDEAFEDEAGHDEGFEESGEGNLEVYEEEEEGEHQDEFFVNATEL
jgi:hypothetical protein